MASPSSPGIYLPEWLRAIGRHRGSDVALRDPTGTVTYAELVDRMDNCGRALLGSGFQPGDRLVTAMQPSTAHVVAVLGSMAAGIAPVPMNTRSTAVEAKAFFERLSPAAVLAEPMFEDLARATGRPQLEVPDSLSTGATAPVAVIGDARALPRPDRELPALILPTGGTTGTPKAAWWDHARLMERLQLIAMNNPVAATDVELYYSPFFHVTLPNMLLSVLLQGRTVLIQPRFDAAAALRALEQGASRLSGAPTMYAALKSAAGFAEAPRSRVTRAIFGSAPATEAFVRELLVDYPNARVANGYGATEFGGTVCVLEHEDLTAGRIRGIGRAYPGVVIRVVDQRGEEVAPGETGEIVVTAPGVSNGYFGDPEQTADTFRPDGVHVGDLGAIDEHGYLHLRGRLKDIIITGGENVWPAEAETALAEHPAVSQIAVYGIQDDHWGEMVCAAVTLRPGRTLTLEDLRTFGRTALAGYKLPREMVVYDALPLTSNNKIDKRALQRQHRLTHAARPS
ncbi:class I adenylate-forming enzyme family protein [Geodermatophilus sp. URMC 64]